MCSPSKRDMQEHVFDEKDKQLTDPHFPEFPILERVNITEDGGVIKDILKHGDGEKPPQKSNVIVHYTGKLASDGSQFDSSRDRGEKFEFNLGEGRVIKSWDLGVASMKIGERAIITCTSDYGYGASGSGANIPGGASLKFDVELFDWEEYQGESVTNDKNIMKMQISEGSGWRKPNDYASVKVRYTGKVIDGITFEDNVERELTIGEDDDVPSGFMTACKNMQKDEKSVFTIKPSVHHFEESLMPKGVTKDDTLQYTIEMVDFTRAKELYEMDTRQKVEFSLKCKARGNELFKRGRLYDAEKRYELMVSNLEKVDNDATEDDRKEANQTLVTAWTNLAACQLKQEKYTEVERNCTKALEKDSGNAKAYFRRAKARNATNDLEGAYKDIRAGVKLKPEDKAMKHLQKQLKVRVRKTRDKQEKMFGNVFQSRLYKDAAPAVDSSTQKKNRKNNRYKKRDGNNNYDRSSRKNNNYRHSKGQRYQSREHGAKDEPKNEKHEPKTETTNTDDNEETVAHSVIAGPDITPNTADQLLAQAEAYEQMMKGSDNTPIRDIKNAQEGEQKSEPSAEKAEKIEPSTENIETSEQAEISA